VRREQRRLEVLGVPAQLRHESLGAALQLLQSRHRSLVQRLPTPGLHHQLDVLQPGRHHVLQGKRRRARPAYRRDRIQLLRHRCHGSEPNGKRSHVSSDFGAGGVEAAGGPPNVHVGVLQKFLGLRSVVLDTQDDAENMRAGAR